ncbi:sensor histidine kinase [Neobacillus kokaensis]|uniref:Histidine kinase n=1 Tax=Neobacillus kokaensis TaxID=2759023 RepID=A0ABQ3NAK0_9BACI|nr:histidine kinase [Neobacillus kokaensis]GHH99551.1 histidine kinase [Neobacillus kokaensis]
MVRYFQHFKEKLTDHLYGSIRAKLVLFFIIVAIVPLLLFGYASYKNSSAIVNQQFNKYETFATSQLEKQLVNIIDQMFVVSNDIQQYLSDPTLIVIKEEIPKTYEGFIEKKNFERFLEAHKTFNTRGIYLITSKGYFYGGSYLNTDKLFQEPFWKESENVKYGDHWIGFYQTQHYDSSKPPEQMIGLIVPIQSQYGVLKGSKLLIETKADELFSYIKFLERDVHAFVTIRNDKKKVLYRSTSDRKPLADDIVRTTNLDAYGWQVEVRVPEKLFYQSSTVIFNYTLLAIFFSILLASLLAMLFADPIAKRLRKLKDSMGRVSAGELDIQVPVKEKDEIASLTNSFNQMVQQIKELIEEISETERLKRKAELRAFHYQINPHLLFNTLNSIQWKARLANAHEVQQMIYHLTEVLHENLNFSDELIPLRKELNTIKHYLKVQEIRYGHMFQYEETVSPEAMNYLIPRLSLQPLFENIFFHAFEDGNGMIKLTVEDKADAFELSLSDNGKGMTADQASIMLQPHESNEKSRGIGVYNVDQRLKLHFGNEYGLKIVSELKKGTTIIMCWPKRSVSYDQSNSSR